jgi:hypothetical protein
MQTSPVGGRVRQRVLILMICEKNCRNLCTDCHMEAGLKLILDLLEMLFGKQHVSINADFNYCNDCDMQ